MISRNRTPLAGAGFSRDVADAMEQRKQVLVDMGHASRLPDERSARPPISSRGWSVPK